MRVLGTKDTRGRRGGLGQHRKDAAVCDAFDSVLGSKRCTGYIHTYMNLNWTEATAMFIICMYVCIGKD